MRENAKKSKKITGQPPPRLLVYLRLPVAGALFFVAKNQVVNIAMIQFLHEFPIFSFLYYSNIIPQSKRKVQYFFK